MNSKIVSLKKYGADVETAIIRCGHDESLYITCLEMFIHDESFNNLEDALLNKQYEKAFEYAHTIKGVSSNLGLTPIFDAVVLIVEPLRAKLPIDYKHLFNNLNKTFIDFKNALNV